ncbi:MAG: protein-L-isoaspartate O-methyltransferase [Alphaproteobacteria bacterium]|nr:protein-L-isoaspartate O-methyltransferase [Alphaproteobacteria bacterium]
MTNALAASDASPDFATARFNMIEGQLRPNQVTDLRILDVMGSLPRELFVPSHLVGVAYLDEDIALMGGRSLMKPMVLARLIQAADIKPTDTVLDLAPATGYSTLVLAALAGRVIAVEPDAVLYAEAEHNIAKYAAGKATVLAGAPVEGCKIHETFDVIFINGSIEFVPQILLDQLAEGGRLVAVMMFHDKPHAAHTGQAAIYRKENGVIAQHMLFNANVRPAPGFTAPRGFVF